jgi:hypothetical protein
MCPGCGQGILVSQVIEDNQSGERKNVIVIPVVINLIELTFLLK